MLKFRQGVTENEDQMNNAKALMINYIDEKSSFTLLINIKHEEISAIDK
jgi:hypothetical protein